MRETHTHSLISHSNPVMFIVGPTASGKTDLSLEIAGAIRSEIINADSRQIYSHMGIGTGWPTDGQIGAAPHHLLGFLSPEKTYSLSEYLASARETIASVQARGNIPLVVGGTGQYIWALAEGWDPPMVPPEPATRRRLQSIIDRKGAAQLHADLLKVDPEGARIIDPRNGRRIIRALEVWESTGIRFSEQRKKRPPPFSSIVIGVQTTDNQLRKNIDRRIDRMLSTGWIEEVSLLMKMGVPDEATAFSSAGYRAIASYLRGQIDLDAMTVLIRAATHRLAKRQKAWFRKMDSRITWREDGSEHENIRDWIAQLPSLSTK